jgi:serine/threonine protein kinase
MIEVGDLIGGKYRVLRKLGEGGMGIVVAAEHVHVSEPVAIKLLKADVVSRPEMLARFVREARTAMKLKSEHVVRVFDVDMIGGAPYIVMELLTGRDLATVIADDGPAPIAVAVDWVMQACESLAEAHALGVVHRDLKPANLFLTKRPDGSASIKVLDFGVSKVAWAADEAGRVTEPSSDPKIAVASSAAQSSAGLTNTNATLGSPRYMSPEQLRSARDVDTRADIWALGATLFEALSGRAPFIGVTTEEITERIHGASTPSVRAFRPQVPSGLDAVLGRCLRKDPNERFADVAALASALAPFGSEEASRSAVRVRAILGVESPRRAGRGRYVVIAAAAVAAIAIPLSFRSRGSTVATPPVEPIRAVASVLSTREPAAPVIASALVVAPSMVAAPLVKPTRPTVRAAASVKPDAALDPAHAFDQPD